MGYRVMQKKSFFGVVNNEVFVLKLILIPYGRIDLGQIGHTANDTPNNRS